MAENKPTNDIAELRGLLFDTLRGLRDKSEPMEIARARAVCDVAQQITDTARIELDLMRITKERVNSEFLPASDGDYPPGALPGTKPAGLPNGTRQTQHGQATTEQIGHGATRTTHRIS